MPIKTVKNGIFKKYQKSSISYGTRFSQPKYHMYKKSKNANKKRKKMKISKNKKNAFFLMSQGSFDPKLGSQVKRCALQPGQRQTDTHTDTHIDTKKEYRGYPLRVSVKCPCQSRLTKKKKRTRRVSGFFSSTYHQGSVQQINVIMYTKVVKIDVLLITGGRKSVVLTFSQFY